MSTTGKFDHSFKVVVIGSSFAGKSSLIIKFADDMFVEKYQNTIGLDFKFKTMKVDDAVCAKYRSYVSADVVGHRRTREVQNYDQQLLQRSRCCSHGGRSN